MYYLKGSIPTRKHSDKEAFQQGECGSVPVGTCLLYTSSIGSIVSFCYNKSSTTTIPFLFLMAYVTLFRNDKGVFEAAMGILEAAMAAIESQGN